MSWGSDALGEIEGAPDFQKEAISLTREPFRSKPNFNLILSLVSKQNLDLERTMRSMLDGFDLDSAVGDQLDILGSILNWSRVDGQSDEDYMSALAARIIALRSGGQLDDILEVFRKIVGDGPTIEAFPAYPAGVLISIDGELVDSDKLDTAFRLASTTVSGGVRLVLEAPVATDSETFTLSPIAEFSLIPVFNGATTLTVLNTEGFPDSGSLILSHLETAEEVVTYTGKTDTTFTGVSATTNNHVLPNITLDDDELTSLGGVAVLDGALTAGDTTITFTDSGGLGNTVFPSSGTAIISQYTSIEEEVTYTSRTATQLLGVSALVNDHPDLNHVTASGGKLATAKDNNE